MAKKIHRHVHEIYCPDCGGRLSTMDHGSTICWECGWSFAPVMHQHNTNPLPPAQIR